MNRIFVSIDGTVKITDEKVDEGLWQEQPMGEEYRGPPIYQEIHDWRKELLAQAEVIKEECAKLAEAWPHPLISRKAKLIRATKFAFSSHNKMLKSTGIAFPLKMLVVLSEPFFKHPENVELEFRETVIHELCHVACPLQGHNQTWQKLNVAMGGNGSVCHTLKKVG